MIYILFVCMAFFSFYVNSKEALPVPPSLRGQRGVLMDERERIVHELNEDYNEVNGRYVITRDEEGRFKLLCRETLSIDQLGLPHIYTVGQSAELLCGDKIASKGETLTFWLL